MSTNENECKKNKSSFRKKYSSNEPEMYEYCATWFVGEWSNWMIYHSKPGLANTNSNIESFNAVLKRDYFERRKVPMRTALTKLIECIVYYSTENTEFKLIPEIKTNVLRRALGYTKDNYKCAKKNRCSVEYNGQSGSNYSLSFKNKNKYHLGYGCTCQYFTKSAICSHLVGWDIIEGLGLFEIKRQQTFVTKNKRGRKKSNAVLNKIGKALEKD